MSLIKRPDARCLGTLMNSNDSRQHISFSANLFSIFFSFCHITIFGCFRYFNHGKKISQWLPSSSPFRFIFWAHFIAISYFLRQPQNFDTTKFRKHRCNKISQTSMLNHFELLSRWSSYLTSIRCYCEYC